MNDDARRRARAQFDGADYDESLRTATAALSDSPDDVELLVLAGRAGIELDAPEAVANLRRATNLAPDNAGAWHHLGEALAAEGEMQEAEAAFRRAVELDPQDQFALTHLGHTALAAGRGEEGVGYLARAADIAHAASTAAISLVDMYRAFGQFDDALAQARRIAGAAPDDALALLDVADLSLAVGQLDEAQHAFERLRELDEVPGRESYPLHGLVRVEIRREQWQRARELVAQTAPIEAHAANAAVAAFLDAQLGRETDQPPASLEQVDGALAASLDDYRRLLAEDRRLALGDLVG